MLKVFDEESTSTTDLSTFLLRLNYLPTKSTEMRVPKLKKKRERRNKEIYSFQLLFNLTHLTNFGLMVICHFGALVLVLRTSLIHG